MVSRSLRLVTLLSSVGLRDHDESRPDTFEPFIKDGPRVVPLELLVLPSHVHLKVSVKYVLYYFFVFIGYFDFQVAQIRGVFHF
mgnify:CR=1 FL=1